MAPFLYVIIPLLMYIPMFAYETYIAFRRIGKPLDKGGAYLHATWESTHTFLILSVNYFMWLYSSAIVVVGQAVFIPLLVFGLAFIMRATLYTYLFYIKRSPRATPVLDTVFALLHVVIAATLLYTVTTTVSIMQGGLYQPNELLPALLWPGLVLTIPLISVPLYFLYHTKSK